MPEIIPVRPDDAWLSQILDRVRSGGDLVLAKDGQAFARLVRVEPVVQKGDPSAPVEFREVVGKEGFVMMKPPEGTPQGPSKPG